MEFNVGEAYDITTGAEMKKKKENKRLILLIVFVVFVLLGIIFGIIFAASYKAQHEIKPLEEDEGEIIATGNNYPWAVGQIDLFQNEYLKNRNILLELANDEINDDATYIRNQRMYVYDDGTFLERTSDYYDGENSDSCILGTMDITAISDYLHTNEEIFRSYWTVEEKYREEENAVGKTFIAHYKGLYAIVEEQRYHDQIYGLYLDADKEIVQNYDLTNVK